MTAVPQEFDWNTIRARLAAAGKAMALADGDPGRRDEVWRDRARRLAERCTGLGVVSQRVNVLAFRIGEEIYGLPVREVAQVAPCRHLTPVPGAPPALLGITSLRGDTLPVAGLRQILELPETGVRPGYLVELRRREDNIGLAVDELDRVHGIETSDIREPDRETLVPARFLSGMTSELLLILDAAALREHPLLVESGAAPRARNASNPG